MTILKKKQTHDAPTEPPHDGEGAKGRPEVSPEVAAEEAETLSPESVATPSATPPPDPETVEAKPSELDVLKGRLLRLQADFDNYRKRQAREFLETRSAAHKDLLEALLVPLDHLDHALASMEQSLGEADPNVQGVLLIQVELRNALERYGLQRMETLGKAFDPLKHEALGTLPASGDIPDGHIAAEVRAGYSLNGKALRAAQVMVAHEG